MTRLPQSTLMTTLTRALLIVLVAGLTASTALAQDYKEAYNEALEAAKAKNYTVAYAKYEEAARGAQQENDTQVLELSNKVLAQLDKINGNKALKQENYEAAKDHFEKGIAHKDDYAYNYYGLGLALKNLDDLKGAVEAWQKAMEVGEATRDRKTVNVAAEAIKDNLYYGASSRLSKQNPTRADADAAIEVLNEARAFVEPDADWHYYMGLAHKAKGQTDEAVASFNQALELHNGSRTDESKIHVELGEIYVSLGNNAQAKEHYEQCTGRYATVAKDAIERYNL